MNKNTKLLACGVMLTVLIGMALLLTRRAEQTPVENAGTAQNAAVKQTALTFQGVECPIRENLQTVLLIGTDSQDPYQQPESSLQDYYNLNQADFLMLLVLDENSNQMHVIQLNRDTMTDVRTLDVLGNYAGTAYKQICLAFNAGDGGAKSCKNTVKAASSLLFDAPIDSYIQIPMSAIGVLNDLVGGVSVTFAEDLTAVDPAFVQGATLRLSGTQAEAFVRARTVLEDDTNLSRMSRQRAYLDGFQRSARNAYSQDPDFSLKLIEKLADCMQSSLTAQQLSDLMERWHEAEVLPIVSPEGELIRGEKYYEFYVDEASLWEMVRDAYCVDAMK